MNQEWTDFNAMDEQKVYNEYEHSTRNFRYAVSVDRIIPAKRPGDFHVQEFQIGPGSQVITTDSSNNTLRTKTVPHKIHAVTK